MPFSKPIREMHEITPIGAAYVEALPDRVKAKSILRNFRKKGVCPASKIFTNQQSITEFYNAHKIN